MLFAQWLKQVAGGEVQLEAANGMGKPFVQRVWAYQAVGCRMHLSGPQFVKLSPQEQRMVVEHLVFDDFFSLSLAKSVVWEWCDRNSSDQLLSASGCWGTGGRVRPGRGELDSRRP